MINWFLHDFVVGLDLLRQWRDRAYQNLGDDIRGEDLRELRTDFEYIARQCDALTVDAISDRVVRTSA